MSRFLWFTVYTHIIQGEGTIPVLLTDPRMWTLWILWKGEQSLTDGNDRKLMTYVTLKQSKFGIRTALLLEGLL